MTGWALLNVYTKEQGRKRRRRPMDVVRLVAFLGTPASELARIMGCTTEALLLAEQNLQALTPTESTRMSDWLSAAWWRHSWRCGESDAQSEAAVRAAASHVERLPWVPDDWLRDLSVAISELSNDIT